MLAACTLESVSKCRMNVRKDFLIMFLKVDNKTTLDLDSP